MSPGVGLAKRVIWYNASMEWKANLGSLKAFDIELDWALIF